MAAKVYYEADADPSIIRGRKVAIIVNYDGFELDPAVADAYFSTIAYLQDRFRQAGRIPPLADLLRAQAATLDLGRSWARA